jgi:hypothetical protein
MGTVQHWRQVGRSIVTVYKWVTGVVDGQIHLRLLQDLGGVRVAALGEYKLSCWRVHLLDGVTTYRHMISSNSPSKILSWSTQL